MDKVSLHFDKISKDYDYYKQKNSFYYDNIKHLLTTLIPKNKKILEFGCGTGDLLSYLKPKTGVGYDISKEMIKIAKLKHSKYKFVNTLPSEIYDVIYMVDVVEHLGNPLSEFKKISNLMNNNSIFINTMANPIWEPLLMFWERRGWKMPEGPHERIGFKEIELIVNKADMKIIKHDYKLLFPINIPLISKSVNKYLEKYLKKYAFIEYFVAQKF